MRSLIVLSILCFSVTKCIAEGFLGWHERVGIVEAEKIRQAEASVSVGGPATPIVGGHIAPLNAHPYLAGLLIDVQGLTGPSACGGSLLTNSRVLTAAHCWNDGRFQAERFTVVLGSMFLFHGGLRVFASSIALHGGYNPFTLANDIAMVGLPINVKFSEAIRPINLPLGRYQNMHFTGAWARASGYGRYSDLTNPTTNTMVRNIFLQTIPLDQCRSWYGNIVLDSNICTSGTGGVGICRGDSGGPLVVDSEGLDILVGVSSFVANEGCELGFPSGFARVTSFLDWILAHL